MDRPADARYTKEHQWVRVEGDIAIIGITDFAQDLLGDVVYVETARPGSSLKQFEKIGEIESVKAVSEIFAPVSGEVLEINERLADSPEIVNGDPFGVGWLLKVRLLDRSELDNLLSPSDYEKLVSEEQSEP